MTPYYDRNGITIYCGDCLEVMPELEPGLDAVIADLPYGITACEWDNVIPLDLLWIEYKRLIKDNGAVVLFGSQPFTTDLISSNREWFKYDWVWDKVISSGFLSCNYRPLVASEGIYIFYNRQPIFNPQKTKKSLNEVKNFQEEKFFDKRITHVYGNARDKQSKRKDEKLPTNVIRINALSHQKSFNKEGGKHPTQKPVALMSYLIRTYTNPNDLILDNAIGSGTTLVAAQNEGRRAVGIEINEEYCKIAIERLRQSSFWSLPETNGKVKAEQLELI